MTFHLTLLTAIIALRRNRLRTALTMLSLVIGTASVITVFALGAGASEAIEDDIATAGMGMAKILTGMFEWPTVVSVEAMLLSFAMATGAGVFFGWYPARRAADIDPIDALRAE